MHTSRDDMEYILRSDLLDVSGG